MTCWPRVSSWSALEIFSRRVDGPAVPKISKQRRLHGRSHRATGFGPEIDPKFAVVVGERIIASALREHPSEFDSEAFKRMTGRLIQLVELRW